MRELSCELSKRISAEEVEAAINNAVHELEMELRKALKRAESMRLELETNENLLKQLQIEWDAERTSLRGELATVKEQLAELQQEHAGDRTKFMEGVEKVVLGSHIHIIRMTELMSILLWNKDVREHYRLLLFM